MNKTFKLVGRYRAKDLQPSWCRGKPNTQAKKRIYTSEADFLKYGIPTGKRWGEFYDISIHQLINEEWVEI